MITRTKKERRFKPARHITLTIAFTFVMLFAFAAGTSECEAADNTSSFSIECGEGHEEAAETIYNYISPNSLYYLNSVALEGTSVKVTCASTIKVSQIIYRMIGDAVMGGWTSTTQFIIDDETQELLWRNNIGLKPISEYQNYQQLQNEISSCKDTDLGDLQNPTFYLLWEKPFDKSIKVSIDTPYCRSTEAPSVECDTVTLTPSYEVGTPFREPVWYSTLPDHSLNYPWIGNYTGVLEGGKQYYACASLGAPWGYYFPKGFSDVTFEVRSGDVWDASSGDEYETLNVGCWITVGHVWSDRWTVTKEPTCSAEGVESRPCTQGCGTSDTRPVAIDPDAHTWGEWEAVKKPTALNAGLAQRVCAGNDSHVEERTLPATGVRGLLLDQIKAKAKNKMNISWTKVTGAEGYDIFFAKCNSKESRTKLKLTKTIKGNSTFVWTKSGLKKNTAYKAQVKAFAYKNGKKTYVRTGPVVHAFTSGGSKKYTNPKSVSVNKASVTLKKGAAFKIKAKVVKLSAKKTLIPKGHGPTLRYYSTNSAIAAVNSSGKITAKASGKCTVYVLAVSGVRKAIAVTVK